MTKTNQQTSPKIGVLIYTYNRIDDAKINMEIIRNVWKKNSFLENVTIVHSFNGDRSWWPEKYLENELLYLNNPGHFLGAELLINKGVEVFRDKYPDIDYLVLLASDTWLVKPAYLENIIRTMQKDKKYLATCAWGTKKESNMFKIGMAIDFCVFDFKWMTEAGMFPIRFSEFVSKYNEIFEYQDVLIFLERVIMLRFKQAIIKSVHIPSDNMVKKIAYEYIHRMEEREPVHMKRKASVHGGYTEERNMYWPKIGIITHHDPAQKRKIFEKLKIPLGLHGERFLKSKSLDYFNNGFIKTSYTKDNKKIKYD